MLTWISLWNDLVIPLMSVDLELYFLAAEIAHNIIHIQHLEDPGLAARDLGIKGGKGAGKGRAYLCVALVMCMNCL